MEIDIPCRGNLNREGVAILVSDKIDFNSKTITRDKECCNIMIKESIYQKDITTVNIYAHNNGAPKYMKQAMTDLQDELNSSTIIVGTSIPHFQ